MGYDIENSFIEQMSKDYNIDIEDVRDIFNQHRCLQDCLTDFNDKLADKSKERNGDG